MANWEKKSAYMLREIVKFKTYIDSLNAAKARKEEIYAERERLDTTAKNDADAANAAISAAVSEKEFKDVLARAAEELTTHRTTSNEADVDEPERITSISPSLISVGRPQGCAGTTA